MSQNTTATNFRSRVESVLAQSVAENWPSWRLSDSIPEPRNLAERNVLSSFNRTIAETVNSLHANRVRHPLALSDDDQPGASHPGPQSTRAQLSDTPVELTDAERSTARASLGAVEGVPLDELSDYHLRLLQGLGPNDPVTRPWAAEMASRTGGNDALLWRAAEQNQRVDSHLAAPIGSGDAPSSAGTSPAGGVWSNQPAGQGGSLLRPASGGTGGAGGAGGSGSPLFQPGGSSGRSVGGSGGDSAGTGFNPAAALPPATPIVEPQLGSANGANSNAETVNRLLADAEQARQRAIQSNESRYSQLLQGYGQRQDDVLGRMDTLNAAGQQNLAGRLGGVDAQYQDSRQGTRDRFAADRTLSANAITSGNSDLSDGYNSRESALSGRQQSTEDAYQQRSADISALYAGLGQQASEDIDRRFNQERAGVTSDAVRRGLFNSSVLDSMRRGVNEDRSREQRRLAEQLRSGEIGLRQQLSGDALAARDRGTALNERLSSGTLQSQERGLERGLGFLGNVRREGVGIDQGYDQARLGFLANSVGQQTSLDEAHRSDELRYAAQLPAETLDVIERRSDTYPSLTDIAQIALQAGRSDGQAGAISGSPGLTGSRGVGLSNPGNFANQYLASQQSAVGQLSALLGPPNTFGGWQFGPGR